VHIKFLYGNLSGNRSLERYSIEANVKAVDNYNVYH
jgi:hypothetical protein